MCGVTAFRLNPASSSRPSSRPLRRSRMLARCAAPPPGSWVAAGDAAAQRGRHRRGAGGHGPPPWSWAERLGKRTGEGLPRAGGAAHTHGRPGRSRPRALRKLLAGPGGFLPAKRGTLKGDLASGLKAGGHSILATGDLLGPAGHLGLRDFASFSNAPCPLLCLIRFRDGFLTSSAV